MILGIPIELLFVEYAWIMQVLSIIIVLGIVDVFDDDFVTGVSINHLTTYHGCQCSILSFVHELDSLSIN